MKNVMAQKEEVLTKLYVLESKDPGQDWNIYAGMSSSVKRWAIEDDANYLRVFEKGKKRSNRTFYRVGIYRKAKK
jgi:hypothetical protein